MKKVNFHSIQKLVRKSCATALALVLLPHPWTTSAFAQQQNAWAGIATQIIPGVTGAVQNAMMQAQMMAPIDLSQSQIRNVPAQNLPAPLNKCIIPQANIEMPKYCAARPDPAELTSVPDISMSQTYRAASQTKQFAEKSVADLDRMLNLGKNEFSNGALTGLQCLEDSFKKEKTRRQGILNAIETRITQVKDRNKKFKEEVKLVELQMNKVRGELLGSVAGSRQNVVDSVNPPVRNFPPACQAILESDPNFQPTSTGLLQIRDANLKPLARQGGDFLANQQIYKDDITRFIQNSKNHIAKYGIDSYRNQNTDLFKGNADLKKRVEVAMAPFMKRVADEEINIRQQLQSVNYDAPPLDKNFKADFATFKADSKSFFRKKFINECVSGGNNNLTIDPEVILSSLRQEGTNNQGTTILSYKAALKNILDSDSFIEDKIQAMKQLDASFGEGNITITLANAKSRSESKPAYAYFQDAIATCEAEFEDDKTFSAQDSGRSASVKIDRAETYLNDLQKLHDTFAADLAKELTNDVLNCDGRATEAGSCKNGAFVVSSPNFCFQSATSCATQVNNCFAAAEQLVQKKTAELNRYADNYNGMVEALFKDQERFLAEFRGSVMQEAGLLNALIPGSDFKLPSDLLVSMPEIGLDPLTNTYLRGTGSADIGAQLDVLAEKMTSLKQALTQQGQLADAELRKYIDAQKNNITKNRDNFAQVLTSCERLMDESERIVSGFNNERKSQEAEARQAAADWCRRFYDLSTNPAAGCGDSVESLYEDGARAIQFINPEGYKLVNRYNNLCRETQSEREAGSEDSDTIPLTARGEIAQNCANGSSWEDAIATQKDDYLKMLGRQYNLSQDELDEFSAYVDGEGDADATAFLESFDESLAESRQLSSSLRNMRKLVSDKPEATTRDEFMRGLGLNLALPAVSAIPQAPSAESCNDACQSNFSNLKNALTAYNNEKDSRKKVERLSEFMNLQKSLTDPTATNPFASAINTSGVDISELKKKEALVRTAKKEVEELLGTRGSNNAEFTPTQCDQIAGQTWGSALNSCLNESSPDANCISDTAQELFEEGRAVSRSIASIGLRSSREAQVEDAFERIGQDKNIVCDALEASRRNSGVGSLEAFDRQILGEQYNEVMR